MAKLAYRRTYIHARLTPWEQVEVPPESLAFAKRRVSFLEGPALNHPLRYLLACAYLQGINDCVQAHIRNPNLASETGGPW